MNKKAIIAEIKLAPGEIGYYDDYSRIYLTSTKPSAYIYAGTNCTQIKHSIKAGRLRLVNGSFDVPKPVVNTVSQPNNKKDPEEPKNTAETPVVSVSKTPTMEAPIEVAETVEPAENTEIVETDSNEENKEEAVIEEETKSEVNVEDAVSEETAANKTNKKAGRSSNKNANKNTTRVQK